MTENTLHTKIFQNAFFLFSGRLFSRILQFFLFIYAARLLGAESFGIFSYGYALVKLLGISMDLGLFHYTVQQLSRNKESVSVYLGAYLTIKVGLVITGFAAIVAAGWIMNKDMLTLKVIYILGLVTVIDNLSLPFNSIFQSYEKMNFEAVFISFSNFIMSVIGYIYLYLYNDLILFCSVYVLGAFMRLCLMAVWCLKSYGKPNWSSDFRFMAAMIKKGITFCLIIVFVTIYYYIDSIMLDYYCGSEIVGYYNAAYRLIEAPLFISESLTTAMFPTISRLYSENKNQLTIVISSVLEKAIIFGLLIAVITAYFSTEIIHLIYGRSYHPSAPALSILIFSVAIIFPGTICGTTIRATDRQTVSAIIAGVGALLNILLNFILIPKYSFIGSAWATLLTESFVFILYLWLLFHYVGRFIEMKHLVRISAVIIITYLILFITKPLGIFFQVITLSSIIPFTIIKIGIVQPFELKRIFLSKLSNRESS